MPSVSSKIDGSGFDRFMLIVREVVPKGKSLVLEGNLDKYLNEKGGWYPQKFDRVWRYALPTLKIIFEDDQTIWINGMPSWELDCDITDSTIYVFGYFLSDVYSHVARELQEMTQMNIDHN